MLVRALAVTPVQNSAPSHLPDVSFLVSSLFPYPDFETEGSKEGGGLKVREWDGSVGRLSFFWIDLDTDFGSGLVDDDVLVEVEEGAKAANADGGCGGRAGCVGC